MTVRLKDLPKATDQALHQLVAGPELKQKIFTAAVGDGAGISLRRKSWIPVFCALTAALVLLVAGLGTRFHTPAGNEVAPGSASHTTVSPVLLRSFLQTGYPE